MMKSMLMFLCLAMVAVSFSEADRKKTNTRIFGGIFGGHGNHHGGGFGHGGFGQGGFGQGGFGQGGFGGSSGCRYWCRTSYNQYYCCENSNQRPTGPVGSKPGACPPVRPHCPPVRNFGPPRTCSNDYSCGGQDKCCFDTCLQHHTCKPPQYGFGR